jgi:predicted dehydrogenase
VNPENGNLSRRNMLTQTAGGIAVASTLTLSNIPKVHAAEDNTIRVALVGCGGRGTGAAANALSVKDQGPIKLVAMADVFPDKMKNSYDALNRQFEKQMEVPEDRKFIGFDGYKKALDCLRPGDIAIFATPPAFRWVHFGYAIEKGINVFMEKPVTVDGPSTRKLLALAEESQKKNLKVGVGLMCRHCEARQELYDRIKQGEIGDVLLLRAYRQAGPTGSAFANPKPKDMNELMYQIRNFHGFLWASGGAFSDFLIHNIDECCWMKDAWPVEAKASGGRHYRGDYVDQNFDNYSVEYTYADGTKLFLEGRCQNGSHNEFASYVHGSKGSAVISASGHSPARCKIYKGQKMTEDEVVWKFGPKEKSPYQLEWDHLVSAIRNNTPYNEAKRGAEASLVTAMGRLAAHTGQKVTYEQALNHDQEFGPNVDKLTLEASVPVLADASGKYPVPEPGIKKHTEY